MAQIGTAGNVPATLGLPNPLHPDVILLHAQMAKVDLTTHNAGAPRVLASTIVIPRRDTGVRRPVLDRTTATA